MHLASGKASYTPSVLQSIGWSKYKRARQLIGPYFLRFFIWHCWLFFFNFDKLYLINQLVKWSEMSTFTSIIKSLLNLTWRFGYLHKYLSKRRIVKRRKKINGIIYLKTEGVFIFPISPFNVYNGFDMYACMRCPASTPACYCSMMLYYPLCMQSHDLFSFFLGHIYTTTLVDP